MNNTDKLAEIENLLGKLPKFSCVEGCSACCGPIMASRLEWKRIEKETGIGEDEYQKQMGNKISNVFAGGDMNCIFLKQGRCSIYAIRPAICRIFGVSEHPRLICPKGGIPESVITKEDTDRALDVIMSLGK